MLPHQPKRTIPEIEGRRGLLVEVSSAAFVGALAAITDQEVTLVDRRGRERHFPRTAGAFIVDDQRVTLVVPQAARPAAKQTTRQHTASGSTAAPHTPRVARASRIYVEGVHDAALIEKIWGDDLREAGVVVEPMHGINDLHSKIDAFRPSSTRRLAILLDHVTVGTKEFRLHEQVTDPHVLVVGHRFVDILAAVKPSCLGIPEWPPVPHPEDYKDGLAARLGYTDARALFHAVLSKVDSWKDFDQSLIRSVEEAIDFVTHPDLDA